jgi:hypothetical protein
LNSRVLCASNHRCSFSRTNWKRFKKQTADTSPVDIQRS